MTEIDIIRQEMGKYKSETLKQIRDFASGFWFPDPEKVKGYENGELGFAKDVIHNLLDSVLAYRTTILRLCDMVERRDKALEVAMQAMKHEGGIVLNDALARIDKILKGKDG